MHIVELTNEEMIMIKFLIENQLGWATYKIEHTYMDDEEKNRMLAEIKVLTKLRKYFNA